MFYSAPTSVGPTSLRIRRAHLCRLKFRSRWDGEVIQPETSGSFRRPTSPFERRNSPGKLVVPAAQRLGMDSNRFLSKVGWYLVRYITRAICSTSMLSPASFTSATLGKLFQHTSNCHARDIKDAKDHGRKGIKASKLQPVRVRRHGLLLHRPGSHIEEVAWDRRHCLL